MDISGFESQLTFIMKNTIKINPNEILPKSFADMIDNASKNLEVDAGMPIMVLLTTISSLLGNTLEIETIRSWKNTANLQTMIVSDPHGGKTEVCKIFVNPVLDIYDKFEKDWYEQVVPEIEDSIWTKERALSSDKVTDDERVALRKEIVPLKKRIKEKCIPYTGDITSEELENTIAGSGECTFNYLSDASGHIYKHVLPSSSQGNFEVYLMGTTGDSQKTNRVNGRAPQNKNMRITSLWGSNKNVLQDMMNEKRLEAQGFWSRHMVYVFDDISSVEIADNAVKLNSSLIKEYEVFCKSLFRKYRIESISNPIDQPALWEPKKYICKMTDGAKLAFLSWINAFRKDLHENHIDSEEKNVFVRQQLVAQKYLLCLHVLENGNDSEKKQVSVETVNRMAKLMEYVFNKQKEAFATSFITQKVEKVNLISNLLDKNKGLFNIRELIKTRKFGTKSTDVLDKALALSEIENFRIIVLKNNKNNKSSIFITNSLTNPKNYIKDIKTTK